MASTWQYPGRLEVYGAIGARIRAARITAGLTQAALADACEVRRTSIVNIEAGRQRLPVQLVYDIAEVLGVPPKSLLPD